MLAIKRLWTSQDRDVFVSFTKFNNEEKFLAIGAESGETFILDLKAKKLYDVPNVGFSRITAIEFFPTRKLQQMSNKTLKNMVYFGDLNGNLMNVIQTDKDEMVPRLMHQYNEFYKGRTKTISKIMVSDDLNRVGAYFVNYPTHIGFKPKDYVPTIPAEVYTGPASTIDLGKEATTKVDSKLGIQKFAVFELNKEFGYDLIFDTSLDEINKEVYPFHNFAKMSVDQNINQLAFSFSYEKESVVINLKTGDLKRLKNIWGHFLTISPDGNLLATAKIDNAKKGIDGREIRIYDLRGSHPKLLTNFKDSSPIRGLRFLANEKNAIAGAAPRKLVLVSEDVIHLFDLSNMRIDNINSAYLPKKAARDIKANFSGATQIRLSAKDGTRMFIPYSKLLGCNGLYEL
jgi:WD40 repeat protein